MSDSKLLEELLSEAESVIQDYKTKYKSSDISNFTPELLPDMNSSRNVNQVVNDSSYSHSSCHASDVSFKGVSVEAINFTNSSGKKQDLRSNYLNLSSDLAFISASQVTLPSINLNKGDEDGNDIKYAVENVTNYSTFSDQAGKNVTNGSTFSHHAEKEAVAAERDTKVLSELRELCWVLLSTASAALRDQARLAKHIETTEGAGSYVLTSGVDGSEAQTLVSQAASRLQHLLVQVSAWQQESQEAEAECTRLCSLLNSLLCCTSDTLTASGLQHLAETSLVSPRRSNAERLVDAACSNLQLLLEQQQSSKQLQLQQEQRVQQLQQHVLDGEMQLHQMTDRCGQLVQELQDCKRQQEQQLQQLYVQLARAEETLKQTQTDLDVAQSSRKLSDAEHETTVAELRKQLTQCQLKFEQSLDSCKELKCQLDHLQLESADRLQQMSAQCEQLRQQRDAIEAAAENSTSSITAAAVAARQQRDAAESAAVLVRGELQALQQQYDHLQALADDKQSENQAISNELAAVKEQLRETSSTQAAEIQQLHDKLCKQACSLCESQQQLRKEQLLQLQLRTQLQLEQQRTKELEVHNKAAQQQVDELNKLLADHLDRRVADDVKAILKSLNDSKINSETIQISSETIKNHSRPIQDFTSSPSNTSLKCSSKQGTRMSETYGKDEVLHCSVVKNEADPVYSHNKLSTSEITPQENRNLFSVGRELGSSYPDVSKVNTRVHTDRYTHRDRDRVTHNDLLDHRDTLMLNNSWTRSKERNSDDIHALDNSNTRSSRISLAYRTPRREFHSSNPDLRHDTRTPERQGVARDAMSGLGSGIVRSKSSGGGVRGASQDFTAQLAQLQALEDDMHALALAPVDDLYTKPDQQYLPQAKTRSFSRTSIDSRLCTDSGLGSSEQTDSVSSPGGGDSGAELRRARAEARRERLEAAKLREKCALLQVEVDARTAEMADERARQRYRRQLYRVKRDEFGQFL
ncbi:uncharacterized protein LOC108675767, partial [Hyalella azteca]|uniref:Uncharacterized protein LOC108675767 n=1 Tax=Hyalella azteca TaxID=294128 RepID=A0A8B7NZM6_HYAAZ